MTALDACGCDHAREQAYVCRAVKREREESFRAGVWLGIVIGGVAGLILAGLTILVALAK